MYSKFISPDELASRFDEDIEKIKPTIEGIENRLRKEIPKNTTIVIENADFLESEIDIKRIIESSQRFDS